MAVQHKDIRVLRAKGIIKSVWTAADIAPYVNDKYINQTLANHFRLSFLRKQESRTKATGFPFTRE
jgi:hypothetical protein